MRKFWRSAAECLVASLALASLSVICYRLHINIATAGFFFVIVVVIISRVGSFVSSVFVAIIAALCLAYLAPPAFSFAVDDPLDIVATIAFLCHFVGHRWTGVPSAEACGRCTFQCELQGD
jgi:K+-sensing histidine kinase KdpD